MFIGWTHNLFFSDNTLSMQSLISFILQIMLIPVTIGLLVGIAKVSNIQHDRQVGLILESKMADSSLANHIWFNDSSWSPQFYNVLRHSSNILQTSFSATLPHHHLPCLPHLDYFPPCLLIPHQSRITSEEKKKRLHIKILVLLTCTTVEKRYF